MGETKEKAMRSKLRIAGVCLAVVVGLFMSGRVASAGPQQDDMKARHEQMMGHRQDMMARMNAIDARLTTLAEQMNASVGEAKISAMAALLNTIVEQHKTMRSQMMMMMMMEMSPGQAAPGQAATEAPEEQELCAIEKPAPSAAPSHNHPAN
jgi:hypothetical protein